MSGFVVQGGILDFFTSSEGKLDLFFFFHSSNTIPTKKNNDHTTYLQSNLVVYYTSLSFYMCHATFKIRKGREYIHRCP